MFSKELYQKYLHTKILGCELIFQPQTNSTNEDAWEYIQNGISHGSLFLTDTQTDGKGRRDNKWFSTPEKSLTFSFILHSKLELEKMGLLPLLTGISIVRGIESATAIQTGLKWPNDIMLNEKKMGGILIESKQIQNGLGVVVGVGLNINENAQDIPHNLRDNAISLAMFSRQTHSREQILSAILNEFETLYNNQMDSIIPLWTDHCIHQDREVSFHSEKGKQQGIFQGISSLGHAEIQINGKTQTFPSGMVIL
jgi:BirA family biotin operon repressor/biotin-[acetyl-CoA-carboxylase] ligase